MTWAGLTAHGSMFACAWKMPVMARFCWITCCLISGVRLLVTPPAVYGTRDGLKHAIAHTVIIESAGIRPNGRRSLTTVCRV